MLKLKKSADEDGASTKIANCKHTVLPSSDCTRISVLQCISLLELEAQIYERGKLFLFLKEAIKQ